jgi:tetratricopeptide (TPR) repeat protein
LNRFRLLLLLFAAIVIAGAVFFGQRRHAAHRNWNALRPAPAATAGTEAPGLDARIAACVNRFQTWPPDRAALAEFSRLCHANGLLESAISGYQALLVLEPDEPHWPHLLASILAGFGRLDEALPLLRRTTQLAPDHLVAWLRLGDALFKSNATNEAETAYQEILKRGPGNVYALLGLARCDLQLERWTAARTHLQQAVASDPTFADAQSLLASVFERLGNPEAAALARSRMQNDGHYTEAPDSWTAELIDYCHNPYTLLTAASSAVADGRPKQALPALRRAMVISPNDPRIHRQLAKILYTLGDQAGARTEMEKAVVLAPTDENMHFDLVDLLKKAKDHEALVRAVAAGIVACPTSAALRFEAGLLAVEAGRLEEAEQDFQFAWQNRPDNPAAARELAALFFHSHRSEDGVGLLEEILVRKPRNTAAHIQLVQHGIETGDPRTTDWIKRALDSGAPQLPSTELQQDYERRFGRTLR